MVSTPVAGHAPSEARSLFIARTYAHLLGAVLAFVLLLAWLFASGWAEAIARPLLSVNWLWVLGAFLLVCGMAGMLAGYWIERYRVRP